MKHQIPLTNDINLCITEKSNDRLELSLFSNPLSVTLDESMTKEDLIKFSKALSSLVKNLMANQNNYYAYDKNSDLYWSKSRQQFVPKIELFDDGMTLLEVQDFVEYAPNLSIRIKIQTFSKSIGNIIYPFVKIDDTQFYADIQDSQAIDKSDAIEYLKNYGSKDWSWILQSSSIAFFLDYNPIYDL